MSALFKLLCLYAYQCLALWATAPTYNVSIEFVTGSFTDVTTKVLRASWAQSIVDLYTAPRAQTSMFELSNTDGTLTPRNNTNLKPGKSIQFTATFGGASAFFNNSNTTSQWAQTPNSTKFDTASGFAMSCMLRVNSFWTTTAGFIDNPSSGGATTNGAKLLFLEGSQVKGRIVDGASTQLTLIDPTTPTLGQTYHYALSTFPGSYLALYRNGTLVASNAMAVGSMQVTGGPMRFGALGNNAPTYRLAGLVDEAMLFNRGLTPSEINSLVGGAADQTARVGFWRFDEGNGLVAYNELNDSNDAFFTGYTSAQSNWGTALNSATSYPLFFGRITEVSVSPHHGARTTIISAIDDWDRVARLTYTTSLFQSTPVQSVFCTLMSLSSVRSFSADSNITDSVGFLWYRDNPSDRSLHDLVKSGMYQLRVDGNGTYYLRGRYWSIFATTVNTYSEPIADNVRMNLNRDTVINQTKINALPRLLTTTVQTLGTIPQPIALPNSGGGMGFWLVYQDPQQPSVEIPVSSLITPVASLDYYASANSDGTGTNLTANISLSFVSFAAAAVVSLYNAGGAGYLARFQVRGYPVARGAQLGAQYDIGSSQTTYGIKNFTIENAAIQDYTYMTGLAQVITADRRDGRDTMDFTLTNEFPDIISINPGDVLSLVDNFSGYVTQWRVKTVQHEMELASGLAHHATFGCETFDSAPWLVLDHTSFGKLDSTRVLAL